MQRGERRHRKVDGGLFGQREPGRIAAELPTAPDLQSSVRQVEMP